MITIQEDTSNIKNAPARLQTFIDTRLTLTPSVIPYSVSIGSDFNYLKYCACFCTVIIRCTETF
jgi:hypothetical protein